MKKSKEIIDMSTGEITASKFNEVRIIETRREDGSIRIQQDFSDCPTLCEQHTAHLTNINYLIDRYKPDELAAYLAARNQYRREITSHDFSTEPDLQGAKNSIYESKKAFDALPDDIKYQFKNHVEFLKYIDVKSNEDKLIRHKILTQSQLNQLKIPDPSNPNASAPNPGPNQSPPSPNQSS